MVVAQAGEAVRSWSQVICDMALREVNGTERTLQPILGGLALRKFGLKDAIQSSSHALEHETLCLFSTWTCCYRVGRVSRSLDYV